MLTELILAFRPRGELQPVAWCADIPYMQVSRTMLLIVVGAVIVGGAGFVLSPQLVTDHFVACGVAVGDDGSSCQANRSTILGVRLSDREYVVWGTSSEAWSEPSSGLPLDSSSAA